MFCVRKYEPDALMTIGNAPSDAGCRMGMRGSTCGSVDDGAPRRVERPAAHDAGERRDDEDREHAGEQPAEPVQRLWR